MIKRVLILLISISAIMLSCAGENTTCEEAGCDAGQHCVVSEDKKESKCEDDCTTDYCSTVKESFCSSITKVCELPCKKTDCEQDSTKVCNETSNQCIDSCLNSQCQENTHCNSKSELCEADCNSETCNEAGNEVCDPESKACVVKASTPCELGNCQESSHCNETTGHCVGGCADIQCIGSNICNPAVVPAVCVKKCSIKGCSDTSFCNPNNELCEAFEDYPTSADGYGTKKGDIIENLSWVDVDNKKVSLLKYHSMYKKTGQPKTIMLIESAGWCGPCRQEAPLVKTFYDDMVLPNGLPRLAVVQTVTNDNNATTPMSDPQGFATRWRNQYNLKFPVVGDTSETLKVYNPDPNNAIPFNMLISAKTMKIIDLQNGTDETLSGVKTKVREMERVILCEDLNCDTENGHYCIVNKEEGTAECS